MMRLYSWQMLWFDLWFLVIILPLLLNATCLDEKLSVTCRVIALIEMDLFLFFWLFIRDHWKKFLLYDAPVPPETLIDYSCC